MKPNIKFSEADTLKLFKSTPKKKCVAFHAFITPELAVKLLSRNVHNRKLNKDRVALLARDIEMDQWMITGETIKIDTNGETCDGQHRLNAIIKSGKPAWCTIITGIDPKAFTVIDRVKPRTVRDDVGIKGKRSPAVYAAVSKLGCDFEKAGNQFNSRVAQKVWLSTNTEYFKYGDKNEKGIYESLDYIHSIEDRQPIISKALAVGFHYCLSKIDKPTADKMMYQFLTGINLSSSDPVYSLRSSLLKYQKDNNVTSVNNEVYFNLISKTWNSIRTGMPMKKTPFKKGEKLPVLV